MLGFQESTLRNELDQLSAQGRAAFAAGCTQRLVSPYRRAIRDTPIAGDIDLMDVAFNYVWTHVLVPHQAEVTERLLSEVLAVIPDQDTPGWTSALAYVDDALAAVVHSLRCLQSGESQEAAWAARRVCEAVDHFVIERDGISPGKAIEETRILSASEIQDELSRQARDLAELKSAGTGLSQLLLDRLRERSTTEPAVAIAE